MRRLLTVITLLLAMMIGNVSAQSGGDPIFSNAVLTCDGRVTFDITNPNAIVEGDYVGITIINSATPIAWAEVTMIVGQKSYQVKFDTTGWFNGRYTRGDLYYNDELLEYTNEETCLNGPSPAPTPTQKPIANSFTITGWSRICANDNFRLSWSGTNLSEVVFYLFDNETQQRSSTSHVTDMTLGTVTVPVLLGEWDGFTAWPIFKGGQIGAQETHEVEHCGTATDPGPTSTVPVPTATAIPNTTPTPVPNTFALTSAQRMCTDQSFKATWTGSNLTAVEFALSNTSDNWTSGWLTAYPASGAFTAPVDHHGYDKVMARATFADGSTAQADADVGTCAEAPVPQPPSQPAPSQPGAVTSLPVTGTGGAHYGVVQLAVVTSAVVLVGAITIIGRKRSMM
ncbi:MAG: hypothetical protein M9950_11285 [Thermomicrobiales bacterium]|nr:hypothetical protein [Thermomicrobiales bacterium]